MFHQNKIYFKDSKNKKKMKKRESKRVDNVGGLVCGVLQCVIIKLIINVDRRGSSARRGRPGVTASPAIWVRSLLSPREPTPAPRWHLAVGFSGERCFVSMCVRARVFIRVILCASDCACVHEIVRSPARRRSAITTGTP